MSRTRLTRSATLAGWVTLAIGALAALGWVARVPALTRLLPEWTAMRITTATSFILSGAALVELADLVSNERRRRAARVAAALVAAGGFWSCAEHVLGVEPWLERSLLSLVGPPGQSRSPSPVTSLSFLLLGLALLDLSRPGKRARLSQASAVLVLLTALLVLIVYAYGDIALHTIAPFSSIAAPSALGLLALSLGVLLAWGKDGPLFVFAGSGLGSVLGRRALPLAVLLPLLAGWLSLNGDRLGLFQVEFAMALVALSNTAIFIALIIAGGLWLNRIDARRAASEAHLERSERHFRALSESLPQLVWTCEGNGSCDYLSPQWVAYTGIPEQEQLGSAWLNQIHPEDRSYTITSWNTAATEGGVFDVEFRIRRHDGVYRWFKTRATPLCNERGRVLKWFGSNTDIQDLRDARNVLEQLNQTLERRVDERTRELSRALERVRLATAAASMGIWDWDVQDNVLVWDETMYQVYGIPPQSFHDALDAWRATVHPDDLPEFERHLARALAGGTDFDMSFRIVRPDQQVRHIRGTAVTHAGPEGRTARIVGVNIDVTAQRAAESALRANETLLREFVKHAPAAIAMLDRDVRYLQASDRWLMDYRLDLPSITGRSHYDVFPDIPQHWKDVHQRVLRGSVEKCDEDPFPRADGRVEWLQWEARPWRLADGSIGGVIFFTQVITARKEMELELHERRAELERSNQDLEQFAYVASHDLQEPLRAVSGCGQILKRRYGEGQLDPMAVQLIDHMVEGAARMQALILDLLAFSRVGARGHELLPVDSGDALKRAIQQLEGALNETNAHVEVKALPRVRGDAEQITQLFQNLMGNALKYRRSEPVRIEIEALSNGPSYEFLVRDNGIGIEPQYFDKIFVLFQRLHTRGEYPGTGIGLAICKKIVERHGGRIWVESAVGQGSAFHFTLPRGDASA